MDWWIDSEKDSIIPYITRNWSSSFQMTYFVSNGIWEMQKINKKIWWAYICNSIKRLSVGYNSGGTFCLLQKIPFLFFIIHAPFNKMQDRSKLIGRVNVKVCHVKNISKFELKFCNSSILSYPSTTITFNENIPRSNYFDNWILSIVLEGYMILKVTI